MAATWTLIGMLGASQLTMFAMFMHMNGSLGGRIDSLASRLDAMNASLSTRIDALAESFVRHTHDV